MALLERFVDFLVQNSCIREEDKTLYHFGMTQGLFMLLNLATTLLLGWFFGLVWQGLIFTLAYLTLRSYSGGYHAKTPCRCYFLSSLITTAFFVFINVGQDWPRSIFLFAVIMASLLIVVFSPLESTIKPLDPTEKKVYKERSLLTLALQLTVAYIFSRLGKEIAASSVLLAIIFVGAMLLLGKVIHSSKN